MYIGNLITDLRILKENGATHVYLDPTELDIVDNRIEVYMDGYDDDDKYIGSVLACKCLIED